MLRYISQTPCGADRHGCRRKVSLKRLYKKLAINRGAAQYVHYSEAKLRPRVYRDVGLAEHHVSRHAMWIESVRRSLHDVKPTRSSGREPGVADDAAIVEQLRRTAPALENELTSLRVTIRAFQSRDSVAERYVTPVVAGRA